MAERVRQNIAFYFALEEIVSRLNSVKWRNRFETRRLFRRMIAQSDGMNLALFVEFTKGGGSLLNGNERIRSVHLVDIDVVGL